jgi:hypothetical protein
VLIEQDELDIFTLPSGSDSVPFDVTARLMPDIAEALPDLNTAMNGVV